jgi:hypothetical protein
MKPFTTLVLGFSSCIAAFPHYAELTYASRSSLHLKVPCNGTLSPKHFDWKAPQEGDRECGSNRKNEIWPNPSLVRAPCPVMNTLANHGFVPRDGRNITRQPFVEACGDALNISPEFADNIFTTGLPSNPTPNATVSTNSAHHSLKDTDMLCTLVLRLGHAS